MPGRVDAHFPVNTLALKRGGLVRAVMQRASALAAHDVVGDVWIEVLSSQPRLVSDVAALKRDGHLHPGVRVRSVLTSLDDSPDQETRQPFRAPEEPDLVRIVAGRERRHHRYFRDGLLMLDVHVDRQGVARRVDHYSPERFRLRSEDLDEAGRVVRVEHFQPNGTRRQQRYIGRDGRCFLTVWQVSGTQDWAVPHLFGREPRSFAGMGELYQYAFERLLAHEDAPVLCSEFRENLPNLPDLNLDEVVRRVRHPRLRRVAVAHSSHLLAPYAAGAAVSPHWAHLLEDLGGWDALVTWTAAQREEIVGRVGHADRVVAVPPAAPPAMEPLPVDPNRVILVARLHPKKRVDEAIRVFREIASENAEARLEVYGFGYGDEEEEKVHALVAELGLCDRVHFMPFSDPGEIYGGACATLLTSASEGFGLVLLESMSHGVPVVAYDSRYGPREVIEDGGNGYLVPAGDSTRAARRVLGLMEDPELRERLGAAAVRSLARFGAEPYLAGWRRVLTGEE